MGMISAYDEQRRSQDSLDRRDRARKVVAYNGGRSAPHSASDFSPSAVAERNANAARAKALPGTPEPTADDRWRETFPSLPNGAPRPLISARGTTPVAPAAPVAPAPPWAQVSPVTTTMPRIDARMVAADAVVPSVTLDPNLPPATVTNTGITRDMPPAPTASPGDGSAGPLGAAGPGHRFAPDSPQRANLRAEHEDIFTEGTPANVAFVAHAKQFGEASAHEHINDILDSTQQ